MNFIYVLLKQPAFFEFVMENVKGVKMPRGKEEHIKTYKLCIPSSKDDQTTIANKINCIEQNIILLENDIMQAQKKQGEILSSYLW